MHRNILLATATVGVDAVSWGAEVDRRFAFRIDDSLRLCPLVVAIILCCLLYLGRW